MDEAPVSDVADVVFALRGQAIALDYAYALSETVARVLDWISSEPHAGIHPIRGATVSGDVLVLSKRAQLVLRLPQSRIEAARALQGVRMDLGGAVEVGDGSIRALAPYPVLYSHFVTTGHDSEQEFLAEATRLITAASIECKLIVGKRRVAACGAACISGYSLMLHGLSPAHSLQAQSSGVGRHHLLGCGVFVPHKSIAPVGG
jgi:CRISPR-associated protein Cas6